MSKRDSTEMPEARRRLLEAAIGLMLRQGFTATTVDQVCAEAHLTKGSFFHYFKTKEEIGEEALDHFCCGQQAHLARGAYRDLADPLDRLHGFLDYLQQNLKSTSAVTSCLVGNLCQELAHTHPRIREKCDEGFSGFVGELTGMLAEAKARNAPRVDFDPGSVATMFLALMQGSLLVGKARQDTALVVDNLEHFRRYLQTLWGGASGRRPRSGAGVAGRSVRSGR